jgi:hypothetical protein
MDSSGSWESVSDDGNAEDDDDDHDEATGAFGGFSTGVVMTMGGFQFGVGRLSFYTGTSNGAGEETDEGMKGFPTKLDLDRNFLDDETMDEGEDEDVFYDMDSHEHDREDNEGEEDPLYPGLYRAMYAFEPEGTAEMALEEDQIVLVMGRGGGVGWAVVVDDQERGQEGEGAGKEKLALVPESYLEPVRLDWMSERA